MRVGVQTSPLFPKLGTTPTQACIPTSVFTTPLRMWKCHRHFRRHPRTDNLGFGAHWGAWPATARTPGSQPPARTLFQPSEGRTRPAGLRKALGHAAVSPLAVRPGERERQTRGAGEGAAGLPEGAACSSAEQPHLAAAPTGTAARRRGRRVARGNRPRPRPTRGPSAPPAPPPPSCTQRLRHIQ